MHTHTHTNICTSISRETVRTTHASLFFIRAYMHIYIYIYTHIYTYIYVCSHSLIIYIHVYNLHMYILFPLFYYCFSFLRISPSFFLFSVSLQTTNSSRRHLQHIPPKMSCCCAMCFSMCFRAFPQTISPFLVEYKAPIWWNTGPFLWSIGLSKISPKEPYIHKTYFIPSQKPCTPARKPHILYPSTRTRKSPPALSRV